MLDTLKKANRTIWTTAVATYIESTIKSIDPDYCVKLKGNKYNTGPKRLSEAYTRNLMGHLDSLLEQKALIELSALLSEFRNELGAARVNGVTPTGIPFSDAIASVPLISEDEENEVKLYRLALRELMKRLTVDKAELIYIRRFRVRMSETNSTEKFKYLDMVKY